jgi:dUTP pyrophosphatase
MEENNEELLNGIFNEEEIDYNLIMQNFGLDMNQLDEVLNNNYDKLVLSYTKSEDEINDLSYNYESDSGFDICSTESIWIHPNDRALIPTGLYFNIPENYELQIRSKSGLSLKKGLMVLNSPGTVDQGYTGEVQVILFNTTNEKIKIEKGQKVAQAVLCPVVCGKWINLMRVDSIENKDRNEKGFGSTGL